jgi:hypothetical protein
MRSSQNQGHRGECYAGEGDYKFFNCILCSVQLGAMRPDVTL